jgi:hypothetical protein
MRPVFSILTPPKKNEYGQKDMETLKVFFNGNTKCGCLSNLYNKDRERYSSCRHVVRFWELIEEENIKELQKYTWIEPNW